MKKHGLPLMLSVGLKSAPLLFTVLSFGQASTSAAQPDTLKQTAIFVEVQPGVKLEVLDYGGTGQPMILLTALGSDAHEWRSFAPKLTGDFHVFAISRRGFGASTVPELTRENYKADRLGDDVLAVMQKLEIQQPVLVGWSVGGAELSSIGSRHPDKVKALIYLDAGYEYAYYGPGRNDPEINRSELAGLLESASEQPQLSTELEKKLLVSVEQNEADLRRDLEERSRQPAQSTSAGPGFSMPPQMTAIEMNGQKYTKIPVPILAIFAYPVAMRFTKDPAERAAQEQRADAGRKLSVETFKAGLPNARVTTIAHAGHDVWKTNEAEVLQDIRVFVTSLEQKQP